MRDARILVVDDQESNRVLLAQMLNRAGYRKVVAIGDSSLAMDRVRSFEPDLIMLDLHMPPPDGLEILAMLEDEACAEDFLPVLVLTADGTDITKEAALASGAHDFVTNPFHYSEVLLRIRNLLRTRMLYEELRRHNIRLNTQLDERSRSDHTAEQRRREITLRTENVLSGAGLVMVFQPVVDLASGGVVGAEALSRFTVEPTRTPDVWFIEAAEVGLGVHLELHAIDSALTQLHALPSNTFVSLNASPDTLCSPLLLEKLRDLAGERIVVELTEHERVDDYDALRTSLAVLRELGIRLAVDDTGAGFASLQHILRLNPDIIKLDRGLISALDREPVQRALVAALVHFARETESVLIAEGIETPEELEVLRQLGVTFGQGYLLGKPAPLPLQQAYVSAAAR